MLEWNRGQQKITSVGVKFCGDRMPAAKAVAWVFTDA